MNLRRRVARLHRAPVTQTSLALLFSQLLLGVTGVIAARALGPSGRGVVAGVTIWMGLLPVLFLFGMHAALGVRVAQRPEDVRVAVGSALVYLATVGVLVAAAAWLLVPPFVGGLGDGAAEIARWAVPAAVMVSTLAEMLLEVALARKRYAVVSTCRVLLPLVPFGVAVGYALSGGLTPRLMIAAHLASAVLCLLWVAASTPWRGTVFDRDAFVADLRFGASTSLSGWAGFMNGRFDVLLMSGFVSAPQLGYYGVANNVMIPVVTIPNAAATLLTPRVAAMVGDGTPGRAELVNRQVTLIRATARRYFLVAVGGGALLGVSAPVLIPLVFGDSFRPSVTLIWILIPGFVARAISSIVEHGAFGMRYARVGNIAELTSLVVTVVLLALLLPPLAATGAAIASTAAYVTTAVVALAVLRRVTRRPVTRPARDEAAASVQIDALEHGAALSQPEATS